MAAKVKLIVRIIASTIMIFTMASLVSAKTTTYKTMLDEVVYGSETYEYVLCDQMCEIVPNRPAVTSLTVSNFDDVYPGHHMLYVASTIYAYNPELNKWSLVGNTSSNSNSDGSYSCTLSRTYTYWYTSSKLKNESTYRFYTYTLPSLSAVADI